MSFFFILSWAHPIAVRQGHTVLIFFFFPFFPLFLSFPSLCQTLTPPINSLKFGGKFRKRRERENKAKKRRLEMGTREKDPLAQLSLPPGFRFYPTDEELLVQYLCRKVAGHDFSLQIIAEIDLYKFDPWVLPSKFIFQSKHRIQPLPKIM